MVPPGGTREKSSGVLMLSAPPEAKKHPRHPRSARGKRFHPAKIPRPKRRGLRGNMVPPSNRARPAMRCRTAFPQKRRDCPPGVLSLGPLQRPVLFVPHCAPRSGGPFCLNRLRSPDPRAPCVERRTCGAAQKRRGGCAAEKRMVGPTVPAWKAGSLVCGLWPHSSSPPKGGHLAPLARLNSAQSALAALRRRKYGMRPPRIKKAPFRARGRLEPPGHSSSSAAAGESSSSSSRREKPRSQPSSRSRGRSLLTRSAAMTPTAVSRMRLRA